MPIVRIDFNSMRTVILCIAASYPSVVACQSPASSARIIASNPVVERPNYRFVFNRCQRLSFGLECALTLTAKEKTQVRYSRHTHLSEKGGHRFFVNSICIGGECQNSPRNIGEYRYLERGQSTDIVYRFDGDIGQVESLSAGFDSFGVRFDTFLFIPAR